MYLEWLKVHIYCSIVQIMIFDVLSFFRLHADVYHNAKVCGDWTISEGHLGQTCFHMPTEGSCQLVVGTQEYQLNTGDLVIFPYEVPHTMYPEQPMDGSQVHLPFPLATDRSGTGMLCGRLRTEHSGFTDILDALPKVIIIRFDEAKDWLEPLLTMVIKESYATESTSNLVLDRLSELIFIYSVREFIEQDYKKTGLLALYAHPKLAPVLEAIHTTPEHAWTIEALAKVAGISRTALAKTFKDQGGWTVMRYISWWRMQIAWLELAQGSSVANVAEHVGYQSEAAFSRSFRKQFGISAGQIRRRNK